MILVIMGSVQSFLTHSAVYTARRTIRKYIPTSQTEMLKIPPPKSKILLTQSTGHIYDQF